MFRPRQRNVLNDRACGHEDWQPERTSRRALRPGGCALACYLGCGLAGDAAHRVFPPHQKTSSTFWDALPAIPFFHERTNATSLKSVDGRRFCSRKMRLLRPTSWELHVGGSSPACVQDVNQGQLH